MNLVDDKYEALIRSYLDGQCTEREALELLSWIAESEENRIYFESYKDVWNVTDFEIPETVDVEAALDAVNMKIDALELSESETKTVEMPWLRRNIRYVSSAAALFLVAMVLGFLVLRPLNSTVTLASNDPNLETPALLPDGTSVTFNGDAALTYPKQFANENRSVDFEGVAYFDVAKDENKPFVIHCSNLDVEVLGTTFLLDASKGAPRYFLDLYTGKVKMIALNAKGNALSELVVHPGERGVLNVAEGELSIMTYPEMKEEQLKTERVLVFDDVCLAKIVETLEYIFNIKIELDEACASRKITARFTDEDPINEVLETIATVSEVTVTKMGEVYQIR